MHVFEICEQAGVPGASHNPIPMSSKTTNLLSGRNSVPTNISQLLYTPTTTIKIIRKWKRKAILRVGGGWVHASAQHVSWKKKSPLFFFSVRTLNRCGLRVTDDSGSSLVQVFMSPRGWWIHIMCTRSPFSRPAAAFRVKWHVWNVCWKGNYSPRATLISSHQEPRVSSITSSYTVITLLCNGRLGTTFTLRTHFAVRFRHRPRSWLLSITLVTVHIVGFWIVCLCVCTQVTTIGGRGQCLAPPPPHFLTRGT